MNIAKRFLNVMAVLLLACPAFSIWFSMYENVYSWEQLAGIVAFAVVPHSILVCISYILGLGATIIHKVN
ncbi:hypothetical protein GCE9029_01188 [Grimontia celer]|uniref:Uncharacterized protein n=1 Tax=Grimontia celer TaxID=1796497 RepID=A0A128EXV7_9GAMM|nr:hypothetical protein GCE9029_01188 [Grimontia celer]